MKRFISRFSSTTLMIAVFFQSQTFAMSCREVLNQNEFSEIQALMEADQKAAPILHVYNGVQDPNVRELVSAHLNEASLILAQSNGLGKNASVVHFLIDGTTYLLTKTRTNGRENEYS